MSHKNELIRQKKLLQLKGEALRVQLELNVFESKQAFKPNRLLLNILGSARTLTLIGTFWAGRKKGTQVSLVLALSSVLLWAKKKLH